MSPIDDASGTDPRVKYENPWIRIVEETYVSPAGTLANFGVVQKADVALVVPFRSGSARVRLVRPWRPLLARPGWEFPQGGVEPSDAAPIDAAARELREETGLRSSELALVGGFAEVGGISSAWVHVFVALDCSELPDARPDVEEIHAQADHSFSDVDRLIMEGECTDAPTLAAIALLERTGHWTRQS